MVKALRQTEVVASQVKLSFGEGGVQSGGGKNRGDVEPGVARDADE